MFFLVNRFSFELQDFEVPRTVLIISDPATYLATTHTLQISTAELLLSLISGFVTKTVQALSRYTEDDHERFGCRI
ncbi:MAG: hypothetical protein JWO13_2333 [Acidobacteriales bacterium]|nr:hypothetical protein [Terriglobales bacterium]